MRLRHLLAATAAALLLPVAALAKGPIKIGFPIPLSGPTAVYGVPILKGAELAVLLLEERARDRKHEDD